MSLYLIAIELLHVASTLVLDVTKFMAKYEPVTCCVNFGARCYKIYAKYEPIFN